MSFWGDNDNNGNNDNIRAGAKFDAGGGAETSFPLTVALHKYDNGHDSAREGANA